MAETKKGFWEGGANGHANNRESSGRPSGLPGTRKPQKTGVRTDIELAATDPGKKK